MSTKLTKEETEKQLQQEEAKKQDIKKQQSINNPNKVIKK